MPTAAFRKQSEVLYRFIEEYGLLEQMRHSNVQHIYDQGVTDDALFIQVEYLPCGTLKQHTSSKGMEPERAWVCCATDMQGAPWRADGEQMAHIISKPHILLAQNKRWVQPRMSAPTSIV